MESPTLDNNQEKKNIRWGIVLTYIRLAAYLAISLFYPPYQLEKVGLTSNGLYGFASSLIAYTLLLSLGIENSYIRFATIAEKEKGEEGLKKTNGFYLITFAAISLLILLAGVILALLYGYNVVPYQDSTPESRILLMKIILVASLAASVDFFFSLFNFFLYYRSRFIAEQLIYLVMHVVTYGGCFLALYLGFDILSVVVVTGAVQVLFDGVSCLFAFKKLKMTFAKPSHDEYRRLLKEVVVFSIYIFMTILVSQVNMNLGKTVLGHLVSMGMVTVFGYGLQFYTYENQIAAAISSSFAPKINRLAVEGKTDEISSLFLKVCELQLLVLFLIVGGFASCGLDFITAWLGKANQLTDENFRQAFFVSLGILLIWLIPLSQYLGIEIQRAENKHHFLSIVNLSLVAVNVGITLLCVFLLPDNYKIYSPVIGMGVATLIGMVVVSDVYYVKELHLPIGRFYAHFALIGSVAVAGWAAVYCLYHFGIVLPSTMNLWIKTLIKGATYIVVYVPLVGVIYHKAIRAMISRHKNEAKPQ